MRTILGVLVWVIGYMISVKVFNLDSTAVFVGFMLGLIATAIVGWGRK